MYAAAAVGLMLTGAVIAQEQASATVSNGTTTSRTLHAKDSTEGNEGLDGLTRPTLCGYNQRDESNEGDDGDESGKPDKDGDEGNERGDGVVGGFIGGFSGDTTSFVICNSQATAATFSIMTDAHVTAITELFFKLCRPDLMIPGRASASH